MKYLLEVVVEVIKLPQLKAIEETKWGGRDSIRKVVHNVKELISDCVLYEALEEDTFFGICFSPLRAVKE